MDGSKSSRPSWNRSADSRYVWVSSSPSPAEVAELEKLFPEVIQVPSAALEAEGSGWEDRAIIARSFSRWVPPEAILREFRRAGIPGEINALCLAHRCYVFRFADQQSKEMALGRPWIANGQIIATEVWSPEFFPKADSVAVAMLWVRLPNLPLEFWSEDILRAILAPAGTFVSSDPSTKDRSRGGFARVCVKVDLRQSLRPGVRIRGCRDPFWQQIVYEQLDGICPTCGSLHLNGSCSSEPESETPSAGTRFGPWMAALRHPRASQGNSSASRGNPTSVSAPGASSVPSEGWLTPTKVARRSPGKTSLALAISSPVSSVEALGKKTATVQNRVKGGTVRAGNVILGSETETGSQTESIKVQSLLNFKAKNSNPFALLASNASFAPDSTGMDVIPGTSKRARPVEIQVLSGSSKKDKRKGKVSSSETNSGHNKFIFSAASDSNRGPAALVAKAAKRTSALGVLQEGVDVVSDPPSQLLSRSHDLVVSSLKEAIMGRDQDLQIMSLAPVVVEDGNGMEVSLVTGPGTSISGCPSDIDMSEGKSGALPPPSVK